MEDNQGLTELKLDIREIKTLLMERKGTAERDRADIDHAHEMMRKLNDELLNEVACRKGMEDKHDQIQEAIRGLSDKVQRLEAELHERFQKLEKEYHKISWIAGVAVAVVAAAAVKFFVG